MVMFVLCQLFDWVQHMKHSEQLASFGVVTEDKVNSKDQLT